MDLAHGRRNYRIILLVAALCTNLQVLSEAYEPLCLEHCRNCSRLCDSADLAGLWHLNEASNTGAWLALPYPNAKLQQGTV